MELSNNIRRQAARLFDDPTPFLEALSQPLRDTKAIAWLQPRPEIIPFPLHPPQHWQPEFVDRLQGDAQAGRHALHDQGAYYCLDSSSVFAAMVLSAVPKKPDLVVDVCASPGGKSIMAFKLLSPLQIVANETIGKRLGALKSNLQRCGVQPSTVTCQDPAKLAEQLPAQADIVIVDAPCSGQSLVARGKEAPGAFHPATVNLNANRQRRILANAAQVVKPGGHLAYITCTYAEKENEGNVSWFLKRFHAFQSVPVPLLTAHQSHLTESPCYRLWPQDGVGAGSFAALFIKAS
jgi:16S rRNA C967 or C1407 C5-methylase (RsmB/RsmF family)